MIKIVMIVPQYAISVKNIPVLVIFLLMDEFSMHFLVPIYKSLIVEGQFSNIPVHVFRFFIKPNHQMQNKHNMRPFLKAGWVLGGVAHSWALTLYEQIIFIS
jgi:hypothetical protein